MITGLLLFIGLVLAVVVGYFKGQGILDKASQVADEIGTE